MIMGKVFFATFKNQTQHRVFIPPERCTLERRVAAMFLGLFLVVFLAQSASVWAQGPKNLAFQTEASTGSGSEPDITGLSLVGLTLIGNSGADRVVTVEVSDSVGTFSAVLCRNVLSGVQGTTITANGITPVRVDCPVAGWKKLRTRISGGTTGTITVVGLGLDRVSSRATSSGGNSTPGGSSGDLQYNNAGALGGFAGSNVCVASYVTKVNANGSVVCTSVGGGDASTNTSSSLDSEVVLFSSTTGKLLKRATLTTPVVKSTAGVLSAAAISGNTSTIATTSGTLTANKQATFDASGNIIASAFTAFTGAIISGTPVSGQVAEWIGATTVQGLSTSGTGNVCRVTGPTLSSPLIAKLANLTSNGFVTTSGSDGTLGIDVNNYLTGNQSITYTGDTAGSGTTAVTLTTSKVNGVSYPATPSTDSVPTVTSSNTVTYKVIPDCDDSGGNHLNYDTTTHVWTCGSSSAGGSPGNAAADGTTKGIAGFQAACFNDNGSGIISFDAPNCTTANGSTKGLLTAADWTTFNAKVATSRSISTTSPLGGGGDLTADRTLTCTTCTTSAAALTANLPVIGGGGQATAVGTRSGNTTGFATFTGTLTTNKQLAWDASGNAIASAVNIGDVSNGTVNPTKATNGINRKNCTIPVGSDDGIVLVDSNLGPQYQLCRIPSAATVEEITVWANAGSPTIMVHRRIGATITPLLTANLAAGTSGAENCSRASASSNTAGVTCLGTLTNVSIPPGSTIGLTSGVAGGVASRMSISVTYLVTAD